MKRLVLLGIVAILAASPVLAAGVIVEVEATVDYNAIRRGTLSVVRPGDPVRMTFVLDSEIYTDDSTFPTRGYHIDTAASSVVLGPVTVGVAESWYVAPMFVVRNDDPAVDGFFLSDSNTAYPFPGVPLTEAGICGPFEAHHDVGYPQERLDSLDILGATGVYDYDGLSRFYTNIVDCGFEAMGLNYERMTITPVAVEVAVDVKPGSCPNPLNRKGSGVFPVAIAGSGDLDVATLDPASIRLEGVAPLRSDYEDVTAPFHPLTGKVDCEMDCAEAMPDGYTDMTLKFSQAEVMAALGGAGNGECVTVRLTGNFRSEYGGGPIVGEDVVVVLDGGSRSAPPANRYLDRDRLTPGTTTLSTDPGTTDPVTHFDRK